jgi:hypothetical protein
MMGHSQKSFDNVVIVYFKLGKFIPDINEERKILMAMSDSNKGFFHQKNFRIQGKI